jgi:hypothetical protein
MIRSFMSSRPATAKAPAGSKMIAYVLYMSSIVFATKPSSTKVSSNFASARISWVKQKLQMEFGLYSSLKRRPQMFKAHPEWLFSQSSVNWTYLAIQVARNPKV